MKTGLTSAVTKAEVDAKNPSLSPDGSKLAVTYFGNDAKGDICLLEKDSKVTCVTGPGLGEHSPFWITNERLGYIQSDDRGSVHKLFSYDFASKQGSQLASGQIYGPAAGPESKLIVYKSNLPEFVIFDADKKSEVRKIPVKLPGAQGLPNFQWTGITYIFRST